MTASSLRFLFLLKYPGRGAGEVCNMEPSVNTDKKQKKTRQPVLWSQDQKQGGLAEQKVIWVIATLFKRNTTRKTVLHSWSEQDQVGSNNSGHTNTTEARWVGPPHLPKGSYQWSQTRNSASTTPSSEEAEWGSIRWCWLAVHTCPTQVMSATSSRTQWRFKLLPSLSGTKPHQHSAFPFPPCKPPSISERPSTDIPHHEPPLPGPAHGT